MTPEQAAAKFHDAAKHVPDDISAKMHRAVLIVERGAKQIAPVRTGTLRRDVQGRVEASGMRGVVGNSKVAPYAIFVHQGTHKMKARPYLTQSLTNNMQTVISTLGEISQSIEMRLS